MKRLVLTLVSVVVLVVAFLYAKEHNFFRKVKEKPVPLITFDYKKAVAVGIHSTNSELFIRRNGELQAWQFQKPEGFPVSADAVGYWLDDYVRLENIGKVSDTDGDLAIYGLAKPAGSFYVELADGSKHTLLIGDELPTSSEMYAKWQETAGVFKIGPADVRRLDKSVVEFMDRYVMHLDFDKVSDMSFAWRGIKWKMEKTQTAKNVFDTKWKLNDQQAMDYMVAAEILGKVVFLKSDEAMIPLDQYKPKGQPDLTFNYTETGSDGAKTTKQFTGYSDGIGETYIREQNGSFWFKIKDYSLKDAANQPYQGMNE